MRVNTILILAFLLSWAVAEDYVTSCSKLRIGTVEGATDVMLDGTATTAFKEFRHIKSEDDVEFKAEVNSAKFYVSNIKLANTIDVQVEASETELLSVSKTVDSSDSNSKFTINLDFKCTSGLTGVSNVYLTFTLDGNVCSTSIVGMRKKCGNDYAFAPIQVSEVGWFSKTILTENGGQTVNQDNIFDDTGIENVVVHTDTNSLTFRVTNMKVNHGKSSDVITMLPPLVRLENQADNVVYPVLRGAGARQHELTAGQYEEFKLEFNCISLEKDSETVEVIFRPAYHSQYIFKVTKECEGLTLSNLIKKEFQDSIVFDFFALVFIFLVLFAMLLGCTIIYVKYKEFKGEDVNVKDVIGNGWESFKNL